MAFGFNATIVVVFLSIQILYVELVLAKTSTNSTNQPTDKISHPATRTELTSPMQQFNVGLDHPDDLNKNQNNGASHGVAVRYDDTLANTSKIIEVQDHEKGQLQTRVKRFVETREETNAREDREHKAHLLVLKLEREGSQRLDRQHKVREKMQKELNRLNAKAWKMYQRVKNERYNLNDADYFMKKKIQDAKDAKIKREKERLRQAEAKRDKATAEREQRDRERMLQSEKNLKEMRVPKKAKKKTKKRKQKKKKRRGKAKNAKKKAKSKKKRNKATKIKAVGNKKTGTVSKKKTKTSGSDSVSNCTMFLLLPSLLLTYILNS